MFLISNKGGGDYRKIIRPLFISVLIVSKIFSNKSLHVITGKLI